MVDLHDFFAVGTLIILEGLLSADNALILAVLVKHLPPKRRQKALLYGIVGAFVLRFVALAFAYWFLKLWYMNALGGAYLAYLAVGHFARRDRKGAPHVSKRPAGPSFWQTVGLVELTDFAFAMDSILVAVGVSDKLWVVYTGGVLGIIAMRIAAGFFVKLLERFPSLEDMAYVLVGWVSVKMLFGAYERFSGTVLHKSLPEPLLPKWLFWSVMGLIVILGVLYSTRRKGTEPVLVASASRSSARSLRTRLPKLSRYGFAGRLVMPYMYALRGRHLSVSGYAPTRRAVRHRPNRSPARRNTSSRAFGRRAR